MTTISFPREKSLACGASGSLLLILSRIWGRTSEKPKRDEGGRVSYAEFAQADSTEAEEKDLWESLALDLQLKVAALLCCSCDPTGTKIRERYDVQNDIRAMRLVSHAWRTLVNNTVKRVCIPHCDFWDAPNGVPLPHGQYPAVTRMDITFCSMNQAAKVFRHCFQDAQRFPSVAQLTIGPFMDGPYKRPEIEHLHDVLRHISIPSLLHLRVHLGSPPHSWLPLPDFPLDYHLFSRVAPLVSLNVSTGTWKTNPFSRTHDFPDLLELCLDDCDGITDRMFTHISTITSLERLSLRNTDIGVRTCPIPHLPTLSSLTCLNLSFTYVSNQDIAPLTALHRLQRLLLESTSIMEYWEPLPAPRPRGFGRPHATETLSQLTSLTCLNLRHTECAQGVHRLSSLTRLRRLHLGGAPHDQHSDTMGVSDTGLQELSTLTQLTRLQVPNNGGIGREGLQAIARMVALQELDIRSTACTDSDLPILRGLPALRVLALDKWGEELGSGFCQLLSAPSLQSVSIRKCRLSALAWGVLGSRTDLRSRCVETPGGYVSYHIIDCGAMSTSCAPHWRFGNMVMYSFRARTSFTDW